MKKGHTEMFAVVFRSLTITLVVVSSYSMLITLPSLIAIAMKYINGYATIHAAYFHHYAVHIFAPWNYCGKFVFYIMLGKQFRQEIALLFCCRKRSSGIYTVNHKNVTFVFDYFANLNLSARPSVCLSYGWTVTKRKKNQSRLLYLKKDHLA